MAQQNVTLKCIPVINYNYFFNPNICHVCKCTVQRTLKTCILCDMIAYCSEEHRVLHRRQHETICHAIIKDNLIGTCGECKSINRCPEHSFTGSHECTMLRLCLQLDIFCAAGNASISTIPKEYLDFNSDFNDMQSFIERFCEMQNYNAVTVTSWMPLHYIISEKLSGPMTLCNVLVRERLLIEQPINHVFEIHIIAESTMDAFSLSAWEMVLHVLSPSTRLVIVTTGKKASQNWIEFQVCEQCKQSRKTLCYKSHPMLYDKHTSWYGKIRPMIILVFHDEYEDDLISVETLRSLQVMGCPIILTTKSNISMEFTTKIEQALSFDKPFPYRICKVNKFSSSRPQRDIRSGSVFFSNTHLFVYDDLNTLSNTAQVCSSVISNVEKY
ncbi:PREDICTED: uncharacterized protein LOC106743963 isoform X2 [Dinoponera quadriceps]|uniref:Uncharacterized protein LOC106743963 isoform X2 n=1 Tax=Dinoponera quadriceps TaxID=609295 RepID=A0A6P3X674_DINQU|nr:PREDICTED: uncharacterized protein LOC106743963 isoform X2 [Dinoponera quadriceps]